MDLHAQSFAQATCLIGSCWCG